MQLAPGTILGRYELLMPLAQGGMATVWAARLSGSHGFEKTVAIKTILPNLSEDPQFETMFLNEARLSMRVVHPNVVQVLDLGQTEGCVLMALEWVDGESLSTLLKAADRHGGLPLRLALYICTKAAAGLHAAHEVRDEDDRPLGIVHRDVSPQNLMVSYQGYVKVVDFGIAKAEEHFVATTRAGDFKGKVPYMAPEQATGAAVDRRTDIFALGTMLYRLTTGVHPFLGPVDMATLHNLLSGVIQPPTSIAPDYPPELEAIVMRCLAKNPDHRFATMAELQHHLETFQQRSGAPVLDHDLATFVNGVLGERRKKRKQDLRNAARALGWNVATGESLPRISLDAAPESRTSPRHQTQASLTPSGPTRISHSGPITGPTFVGVAQNADTDRPPLTKVFLGMGVVAAVVGAAAAALLLSRSAPPDTSQAGSVAASVAAPASASPSPAPTTLATAAATADASASPSTTAATTVAPPVVTSIAAPPPRLPPRPAVPTGKPPAPEDGPDLGF